jgi:hypothetical protein
MRIITANDAEVARRVYVKQLEVNGVVLGSGMHVYVETVHRAEGAKRAWLCYVSAARPDAA